MKPADRFEHDVADHINSFDNVTAKRPKVSTKYSDVLIEMATKRVWLEVKMGHADNLGNTRVFYNGQHWDGSRDKNGNLTPLKEFCINTLNAHDHPKKFVDDLRSFSGMDTMMVPTTRGGLKHEHAVPLTIMKAFFEDRDRYILKEDEVDLAALVRDHYLLGKAEPAHYLQAGDDLYMIGTENPLGLPSDIPQVEGIGTFKVRVSTRSRFYEVQPEVKIRTMCNSPYSLKPGTEKKNPFDYLR